MQTETTIYFTIWSRSPFSNIWLIERTHSKDYIYNLLGTSTPGEEKGINGRIYAFFPEGINPNKIG